MARGGGSGMDAVVSYVYFIYEEAFCGRVVWSSGVVEGCGLAGW